MDRNHFRSALKKLAPMPVLPAHGLNTLSTHKLSKVATFTRAVPRSDICEKTFKLEKLYQPGQVP